MNLSNPSDESCQQLFGGHAWVIRVHRQYLYNMRVGNQSERFILGRNQMPSQGKFGLFTDTPRFQIRPFQALFLSILRLRPVLLGTLN